MIAWSLLLITRETIIIRLGNGIPEGKKYIIFSYLSFNNNRCTDRESSWLMLFCLLVS